LEFLVETDVHWPPEGDAERREMLIGAEARRASELIRQGLLRRLWRVPGRWANIGLWEALDATELHEALATLPFYPWLKIVVRPLAIHPSDPARNRAARDDSHGVEDRGDR
jgi:muconolactone D-isomerase